MVLPVAFLLSEVRVLVRWMLLTCMLLLKIENYYYVPRLPYTSTLDKPAIFHGDLRVGKSLWKRVGKTINCEVMIILSLYFKHIHAAIRRTAK